jgi:hypothetical protein
MTYWIVFLIYRDILGEFSVIEYTSAEEIKLLPQKTMFNFAG